MTEHDTGPDSHVGSHPVDRGERRVASLPPVIATGALVERFNRLCTRSGGPFPGRGPNEVVTAVVRVLRELQTQVGEIPADERTRHQLGDVLGVLIVAIEKLLDEVASTVFRETPTQTAGKPQPDRLGRLRPAIDRVSRSKNSKSNSAAGHQDLPAEDRRAEELHDGALAAARTALESLEKAFSRAPQPPEVRIRPWHEDTSLMTLAQDLVAAAQRHSADLAWAAIGQLRTALRRQGIQIVRYDTELAPEEQARLFTFHGPGDGPSPQFEELTPAFTVQAENGAPHLVVRGEVRCSSLPAGAQEDEPRGEGTGDIPS
ncbi:hypothetical protein [Streptomyces sp. PSKA30]|uniref:hypothetical protein n=1 Tax=Streptomyces sp. PSKA30 TaxID=2874597 RepID=UPI001CD1442D|nr:hypothetical protein [Streptomyces sp. PSKA30]MBZ9639526.1 hypothetical protein [Streptomyces sp. PSKA30]